MKKPNFLSFLRTSYVWIVLLVIYIPLLIVVLLSFTSPSIKGNVTSAFNWNDGSNYLSLSTNQFTEALANTLIISIAVVPTSVFIATITCFGIWNAKKFYQKATTISAQTNIVIPDIITGISLAMLFVFTVIPLGFNFGFGTIILAHISYCTPYAIILIYPRMQKMNKNLILASYDLGYGKIKTFFKIVIPYLLPSIISAIVLTFAMSFDDFIITKLVGGKVNTISTELYSMAKGIKIWAIVFGSLMVMATIFVISIIALVKAHELRKIKKINNKIKLEIWNKQD
ncbi:ABC transporter permease [Ureaplasma canigenitalium]|uniref:ABC transporter permease n=1 Tax=Ureaplasma canigenitalium TaxID=42092 RepID=UPI0004E2172C|nr:ABC transporter permease [Ureaplasma canigenitalium]